MLARLDRMSGGAVVTIGAPEKASASPDGERNGGRMRLLVVTPRFLPETGGVETHVYETGRRLAALGVAVTVLCTDTSGHLAPHDTIDDVTIRRVRAYPTDRDLRLAPAIGRIVREGAWDLVHVQSYHTLVAPHAMLASVRSGTPFLLSFHGGGHSGRMRTLIRPAQQWALRPLLARAARLIALARFEVELYGRRLRLPPERFASVPNGSDLPSLPPGAAPRVDPDLIASVGRLEHYKGHHRVIAALPQVLAKRPGARLWIAGSGPYRSELERTARRFGVGERVEIRAIPPSERSTMAAELSRAAVVTLLSDFETHPLVVLEAAALGRPVLVADTSGLSELAQQGFARAIPLDSSPQRTAAAIIEEMSRPEVTPRPTIPTWDDCAGQLLAVYRDILGTAS
jgi:glycosyltransferase involved in cell wall biosynthesis